MSPQHGNESLQKKKKERKKERNKIKKRKEKILERTLVMCMIVFSVMQKAMQKLLRGNELELAVSVGLVLEDVEDLTSIAAELLSRRCEKLGKW